jgi:O-antigen ligase
MRDSQDMESDRNSNSSESLREIRASWLGLPRIEWSLMLLGLCVFTFSIVTYYLPIAEIGIAIAAVGLFFRAGKLRVPFPVWIYGAFVLWAFIASSTSEYPEIARDQVLEQLKLFVIILIAINALRTEGQLRYYLFFFLGCFVLFPIRGTLVNYFVYKEHPFGRAIWNYIYSNSNDLAALSLIALGIALALTASGVSRTVARIGAGISAILVLVVILLTQSRGAFIGLVIGMSPSFIKLGMKRSRYFVPIVLVGLAIVYAIPETVWTRISGIEKLTSESTIAEADPEGSAEQRFEIQKVAWRIFSDNPVFGVGLGVYPKANASYAPDLGARDAHNTYLSLAAEVGLPGLLLWLACFGTVLRYAYGRRRLAAPGVLATQQVWIERSLLGYFVAAIFGTYSALSFPYLMLAVLWSSAAMLEPMSPQAEDPDQTTSL